MHVPGERLFTYTHISSPFVASGRYLKQTLSKACFLANILYVDDTRNHCIPILISWFATIPSDLKLHGLHEELTALLPMRATETKSATAVAVSTSHNSSDTVEATATINGWFVVWLFLERVINNEAEIRQRLLWCCSVFVGDRSSSSGCEFI